MTFSSDKDKLYTNKPRKIYFWNRISQKTFHCKLSHQALRMRCVIINEKEFLFLVCIYLCSVVSEWHEKRNNVHCMNSILLLGMLLFLDFFLFVCLFCESFCLFRGGKQENFSSEKPKRKTHWSWMVNKKSHKINMFAEENMINFYLSFLRSFWLFWF